MPELTFSRGDRVRDTYTGKPGFITGKTRPFGESFSWQVGFGDSETVFIRESYMELISDDDDMFSLFEQCRFNGVMDLRRIIQQIRLEGKLTNIFYSMHNSSTKFMPRQFKPVMKFMESATGRLLIADEVGLGKTIEAIYIWKELLTRENAKRFLIVCPAQLCQKWKNDLMYYFGIPSSIVGAKDLLDRLKESLMNYNSDNFVLITSIQGIRHREKENEVSIGYNSRSKLNDFFEQFDREHNDELFDLVVIDEAHYLRNNTTASYNTGEHLRDISRYILLLSATPIQTSSENLYNLLRLLSPEDFYNHFIFDEMLKENRSIINMANAIRGNQPKSVLQSLYPKFSKKYSIQGGI
jgi:SNF2 family DNA or RNA helicase